MQKTLNFVLIFFLLLNLISSPFERLSTTPLEGKGLNPLLQTFWMSIHPPIVLWGYVFVILAFALVLAGMKTGEKRENRLFKLSLRAAWLLLTLGIATGGLWAYEVLGWGGYWSWDPLETASLLPWLALTAYFHLSSLSKKDQSLTRELMILLTFVSVIFTTAVIRGGWTVSVHTFGTSPIGPALLLLALVMTFYFLYLKRGTKKPLFSLTIEKSSLRSVSFFIGFWSLLLIFLVCFWGLALPMISSTFLANPIAVGADYFINWNFLFVIAFVVALIGCSIYAKTSYRKFALLVVGALSVGVVLAGVRWPTPNVLANLGIPLLIVALFPVAYRLIRVLPKRRRSLQLFGSSLLHLGIIVILIGVFVSATTRQGIDIWAKPNIPVETSGLKIELRNFTVYNGTQSVYSLQLEHFVPEYSALKVDVVVEQEGSIYEGAFRIRHYTLYGVVHEPLIIATWTGDIYVHSHETESVHNALEQILVGREVLPEDLTVTVERIPLIHLVWAGATLLCIGIAVLLVKELVRPVLQKVDND